MATVKKILVVGDEGCGKTSLLKAFYEDHKFNRDISPPPSPDNSESFEELPQLPTCVPAPPPGFVSFYSPQTCALDIDGKLTEFEVEEAASKECYSLTRSLSYEDKDVIILCFSLDTPSTLENISVVWLPEAKKYCPNAPLILVGNKKDLQNDRVLKSADGRTLAEKISAYSYVECSAKSKKGIRQVFETALRSVS